MKEKSKRHLQSTRIKLILIGIGLGVLFWIFESAAHVFVFRDVSFTQQIFGPKPHEIWMRLTVVGMFVAFGVYSQLIVTARRQAEKAVTLANAELNQIFNTAADGMRVVDKGFNVIRANETFSALSGVSKDETIGKKCYEVFPGPMCHTKECPFIRILGNADRIEYDSEKMRKDGVKVPCIVTATPFRGPGGELIGIVEDFKDISERKRSELELTQSHERLRDLTSHLQVVREEERTHIAREIHDELGQALTALKMDVYWLRHRLPGEELPMIDKTNDMSRLIDRTVQSVKKISAELRPGLLDHFGLSAAIEWEAGEFSKRTDIECEIISDTEDIALTQELSTAIFRIFQETLTNIARHANATKVEVILKKNAERVKMRVSDNGKGIEDRDILDPKSFGITGMRERVHYLGGNLSIRGNSNGTTVEVIIPFDQKGDIDGKDTYSR